MRRKAVSKLQGAAFKAERAGLCVIPVKADGSKSPAVSSLTRYFNHRTTPSELEGLIPRSAMGIAIVCGRVSGGLEMLEFEGRAMEDDTFKNFLGLIESAGLGQVWERVENGYVQESPSGGRHYFLRVPDPARNQKLARRPGDVGQSGKPSVDVLIETRGDGGYVIAAPSSGPVHASKKPWKALRGGFADIPSLTVEERDAIYRVARTLDRMEPKQVRNGDMKKPDSGVRPGDAYNESDGIEEVTLELLENHGWQVVNKQAYGYALRRPGKSSGLSATLGYCGTGVLYVFSSSTVFEDNQAHSPFAVFAQLEFEGDFSKAAKELAKRGFGDSRDREAGGSGSPREARGSEGTVGTVGTEKTGETVALKIRRASEVQPRRASFSFEGRIFMNHLNILAGIGGHNKSTLTCELAARGSRGELDGALLATPLRVLIASAEDAMEEVIQPRLLSAGAELDNLILLEEPIGLPGDVERLGKTIREEKIDLLIVDPLVAYLETDVDSHRDHSVRRALAALKDLGEKEGLTVLAVMHLNKGRGGGMYERLSGSAGFFNAARSVLTMTADPRSPDDNSRRILWHTKCNAGPIVPPMECFTTQTQVPSSDGDIPTLRLQFGEQVPELSLEDGLLPKERVQEAFEVRNWIQEEVGKGALPVQTLAERGREEGYSEAEIRRGVAQLGYYRGPSGFGGPWMVRAVDPRQEMLAMSRSAEE